ncbi:MAG: hypothetical protein L0215_27320 [Gemmataceae bacterium]|nr:hypothetical protein [Gemmataceae bacterium]
MPATEGITLFTILCRLTWMLFGPFALMFAAFSIVRLGESWLTAADIAFFVILGVMLLGRYLEFQSGQAQTASGEPATRAHLVRYLTVMPVVAIGAWVLLNLVAVHWLARS